MTKINSFGQFLRVWRTQNQYSQMQLAERAETTSRYVSFLETGRSRPGREIVIRLGAALNLSQTNLNRLLDSAGYLPEYLESSGLTEASYENEQFRNSIQNILNSHSPYPACASDTLSRILFANETFEAFLPGLTNRTAEESIDDFFGPGVMRNVVENWPEIAWHFIDRRNIDQATSADPHVKAMADRALNHMKGVPRPEHRDFDANSPMAYNPVFLINDKRISMYATVMRYEAIHHSGLDEVRITLFHPSNEQAKDYFHSLEARFHSNQLSRIS